MPVTRSPDGMIPGSLTVDRDMDVSGMVAKDVIVTGPFRVSVSGMVNGDLIVAEGATVDISGMVAGNVVDFGGDILVSGFTGEVITGAA